MTIIAFGSIVSDPVIWSALIVIVIVGELFVIVQLKFVYRFALHDSTIFAPWPKRNSTLNIFEPLAMKYASPTPQLWLNGIDSTIFFDVTAADIEHGITWLSSFLHCNTNAVPRVIIILDDSDPRKCRIEYRITIIGNANFEVCCAYSVNENCHISICWVGGSSAQCNYYDRCRLKCNRKCYRNLSYRMSGYLLGTYISALRLRVL